MGTILNLKDLVWVREKITRGGTATTQGTGGKEGELKK